MAGYGGLGNIALISQVEVSHIYIEIYTSILYISHRSSALSLAMAAMAVDSMKRNSS